MKKSKKNSKPCIKVDKKKNKVWWYSNLKKYKFHENKSAISINDIDINKIVVSNKFPFSKQDFIYCIIGYKNDKNQTCIFFPKVSAYGIDFDETECMYFMIKEENVLDKYMEIGEKVDYIIKKINSELIYSKKYLIAKKNSTQKKSNTSTSDIDWLSL